MAIIFRGHYDMPVDGNTAYLRSFQPVVATTAAIDFKNPESGTYTYAMTFGTATGACVANTKTLQSQTAPLAAIIPIKFGSTNCWIPCMSAIPVI